MLICIRKKYVEVQENTILQKLANTNALKISIKPIQAIATYDFSHAQFRLRFSIGN